MSEEPLEGEVQEFQQSGVSLVPMGAALVKAENDSIMSMAMTRERDIGVCVARAKREIAAVPMFAEKLAYRVEVGSKRNDETGQWEKTYAEDLSINGALLCARNYGFNSFGARVVNEDADSCTIVGYFIDFQNGTKSEFPRSFSRWYKPALRKDRFGNIKNPPEELNPDGTVKAKRMDERMWENKKLAESSKALRGAIKRGVPASLHYEIYSCVLDTIANYAASDIRANLQKTIDAAARMGINEELLTKWLGRNIDMINPKEFANLKLTLRAIVDGQTDIDHAFYPERFVDSDGVSTEKTEPQTPTPPPPATRIEQATANLKKPKPITGPATKTDEPKGDESLL